MWFEETNGIFVAKIMIFILIIEKEPHLFFAAYVAIKTLSF